MQFTTIISLLFVATAIAAPITISDKRQITPTGSKTFCFCFLPPNNMRLVSDFSLLLFSQHLWR